MWWAERARSAAGDGRRPRRWRRIARSGAPRGDRGCAPSPRGGAPNTPAAPAGITSGEAHAALCSRYPFPEMSHRQAFHLFVESRAPELLCRVMLALDLQDCEGLLLTASPKLPGVWLTLGDGRDGVNFWGRFGENGVPDGMVRWWEVSNEDALDDDDPSFVEAYAPDGNQRWEAKLEPDLRRLQKEVGAAASGRTFLPNEDVAVGIDLSDPEWEEDVAGALGAKTPRRRRPRGAPEHRKPARPRRGPVAVRSRGRSTASPRDASSRGRARVPLHAQWGRARCLGQRARPVPG
jgi:hypothetical protein